MNKYSYRNTVTTLITNLSETIRGKVAFKTSDIHWLQTEDPTLVLVSIHSKFHKNMDGDLKMAALMETIKNHVRGKITILFSDTAHLHTYSLECLINPLGACLKQAQELACRYQDCFSGCAVAFWHSYICQDNHYTPSLKQLWEHYRLDPLFRDLLQSDAESNYDTHCNPCISKSMFIEKALEDLLEQGACLLVLAQKGYRFQFYPGKPYASIEYINQFLIPREKRVDWVHVFLSIENRSRSELYLNR